MTEKKHEDEKQEQVEETQIENEAQVEILSEAAVAAILNESGLPDAAKERLKAAEYENEEAVKEQVAAEVEYLKTITEAGRPMMHGDREQPKAAERMSEEEYLREYDAIRQRHGQEPLYANVYGGK